MNQTLEIDDYKRPTEEEMEIISQTKCCNCRKEYTGQDVWFVRILYLKWWCEDHGKEK